MNINEFAERIVFGKTLEDKLTDPGPLMLSTARHCPHVNALRAPSRPPGMELHNGRGASQPPKDAELENPSGRGHLLHFLANHELLAAELMALVLLKFPEAPYAFRQGVLVTLREEQEHTRLYLRRMQECGVEFGSLPLSGHFWRIVEPMQSPMDFVSRLSLTFEQANLDYSLHFARLFRQVGDMETASILQRIYEDEIGHVQHGLHWFRLWKSPENSDWEAFQQALTFPMSPQRARGPRGSFNREGRLRAGLTDDFIDSVEFYRQSRGRTPTIHWFDPAAEAELTGSSTDRELKLFDQLGEDLECLLVAIAKQDDVMLLRRMPSVEFRKQLMEAGFDLPEFLQIQDRGKLQERRLHDFSPWAWTPRNQALTTPFAHVTRYVHNAWRDEHRSLYCKTWGAARLKEWLSEEVPDWFTTSDCVGIAIEHTSDVPTALCELASRGYSHAIAKENLATSGRGQRRLPCTADLSQSDHDWLRRLFKKAKDANASNELRYADRYTAIIEPELDRVVDLSFLWHLPQRDAEVQFLGWTRPLVTLGRRYAGTQLGHPFANCGASTARFLLANHYERLHATKDWLTPRVADALAALNWHGYFGIDALVCRNAQGELRMKPMVELNPRMTMGHIALRLQRYLVPGVEAIFRIFNRLEWNRTAVQLGQQPWESARDGRWKNGVCLLTEVTPATRLVAAVLIGKQACQAAEQGITSS